MADWLVLLIGGMPCWQYSIHGEVTRSLRLPYEIYLTVWPYLGIYFLGSDIKSTYYAMTLNLLTMLWNKIHLARNLPTFLDSNMKYMHALT